MTADRPDASAPPPAATRRGDGTALLMLAFVSAAVQLPFLRRGISFYDEGSILAIADALHNGEHLYRDRATPTAPLTYELLARLFDLFGPHLLVGRLLQAFVFVLTVLVVYAVLRHFVGVRGAMAGALTLLPLKTLAFPFWTVVNYSQLGLLWWLATMAALLRYLCTERRYWAALGGLGIGVTLVTKQNLGAVLALACAMTISLDAVRRDAHRLPAWAIGMALLVIPSLVPVAGFAAYYAWCGSLAAANGRAVVGLLHLVQPYGVPLPWRFGNADIGHIIFTYFPTPIAHLSWQGRFDVFAPWVFQPIGHLVKLLYFGPLLALAGVAVSLVPGVWRREDRRQWSCRVLVVALGAGAYASMLYRADWTHLMNVAPPLIVACVLPLQTLAARSRPWRIVTGGLWGLWMGLGVLGAVAVFAVYEVPVHTPRGELLVPRAEAEDTERMLAFLDSRRRDERILFLRAEPLYYFLSGRRIPGEFDLLMPGLLGPDDDAHLASDLPGLDLIVYNPKRFLTVPSLITEYAPQTARVMVEQFEPTTVLSPTAVVFSRRHPPLRPAVHVRDLWAAPQEGPFTAERTSWMTYRVLAQTVAERGVERCVTIRHDVEPQERLVVLPMLHPVTWVERIGEPDRVPDAAPAAFRIVAVSSTGREDTLFTGVRRPGLPGPAADVSLARYAGSPALLRLCVSLPADRPPGPAVALAGWAEPEIVRDRPAP